jgi:Uri superfamily endonuclease
MMKGLYVLIIEVEAYTTLDIKSVRSRTLERGTYVYVGSAMGSGSTSLEKRLARHFRKEKKTHWHVDHLLRSAGGPRYAFWAESSEHSECLLVSALAKNPSFDPISKGFGASDCRRGCYSHLAKYVGTSDVRAALKKAFLSLGFTAHYTEDGRL